jgi:hypothetical protein
VSTLVRKRGRRYLQRNFHCYDADYRSREYACPVCKMKNVELLPDPEPGTATERPKDTPVLLSFGYQKDQNGSTSQSNTSPAGMYIMKEGS